MDWRNRRDLVRRILVLGAGHKYQFVASGKNGRAGWTKTRSAPNDGFARPTAEVIIRKVEKRKARHV
jgi:hypothetical protein